MRKVEEEVAWFDKYFFKTAKAEDEALKKDSPLRDLSRKDKVAIGNIAGIGRVYATPGHKGEAMYPIPEIVQRGGLLIGRFEVTRAQFGEFDKNYKFDAGSANYPAGTISLERAQAYVDWLSKQTKDKYRLPYEDEVKSLYENREGENTLDYWAGYAPNPEDAAKLREKAKALGGTAPLLKEVGSFAGQGKEDEERGYDLGGNGAEWLLTRDRRGKGIGGRADWRADPQADGPA